MIQNTLESAGTAIVKTGGLALAAAPVFVFVGLPFWLIKKACEAWQASREPRITLEERKAWLESETDPVIRDYLEFTFNFIDED